MSTSQRGGRSNGKSRSSVSGGRASSARKRQKVGTPGGAGRGVEFEAAILDATPTRGGAGGAAGGAAAAAAAAAGSKGDESESEDMDTLSYDDVSNLSTVTPVVLKRAVSRAGGGGGGAAGPKHRQQEEEEQQPQSGKGKKRAAEQQQQRREEANKEGEGEGEGENESGAAKRRKRRQQEAAAAAAATATATATVAAPTTKTPRASKPNAVTPKAASSSSSSAKNKSNGEANGGTPAAAVAEAANPRSAMSSKDKRGGSKTSQAGGKGGGGEKRGGARAGKPTVRKAPRYPNVPFEGSGGKARTIEDALKMAVTAEVEGLIRKRGKEPGCKAAVEACVSIGKEILRRASEICVDMQPPPKIDLKEARRTFSEKSRRQLAQIAEEEELWAIEEQKCMALAESNKRTRAKVDAFDARRDSGQAFSLTGKEELRALLDPMDDDEGDNSSALSDGAEFSKRVSNQVLASTNDMLMNASAIGRCLQEMGAGVADAQETKERLAQVFGKVVFRNYPNAHDPKAGIAAMLK